MNAPITKQEWERLRREATEALPAVIEQVGLPKVLLAYQSKTVRLMESACPVLFIEKSRRVGETWALAAGAVLKAGKARSAGGMDAMYISYSQEMTREFIDACAMWARAYSIAALDQEEFLFDDGDDEGDRSIQAFRIRFASGFEIVALSSAPRSLRGKQGLVIIDEAAFVDNLKELLKAALAFLMWGGQVIVCSTHDGAENPFNVHVQEILAGRSKYAHLRIDFDQALQDGLFERICLVTGREWSPEAEAEWRQEIIDFYGDGADEELFCIPSKGSGTFLSAPLIEARMTLTAEQAPIIRMELPPDYLQKSKLEQSQLFEPLLDRVKEVVDSLDQDLSHFLGYDPARKSDPAVIELLATQRNLSRHSALTVEMRNVPFMEQKRVAAHILGGAPRIMGAAIDATGMGMNLAEDLGRAFGLRDNEEGSGLVWPISLRANWYNENFPPLRAAFEDDTIALARDEHHLSDLRLVKLIRGIPMIPDEREGTKGNRRHGDFAVALVLAYFASRLRWREYGYEAVASPSAGGGRGGAGRGGDFMRPDHSDDYTGGSGWRMPLGSRLRGGI